MILFILVIVLVVYSLYFKPFSYFKNIKLIFIAILVTLVVILISSRVINRFFEEKTTNIQEILYKQKFNKIYPWTGTSIRLLQLRILHEQIEEESIFWQGFGLFTSRDNLKKRHLKFNTYFGYHTYNYHNQYAQIFSEAGIFGLLLLVLMLFYNFKKALKTKNFLFISFAIIIPIVFLTESFLWVQRGIIFFTVFYCLLNRTNFNSLKRYNNKRKFFSK